jgi:hypothetical protein
MLILAGSTELMGEDVDTKIPKTLTGQWEHLTLSLSRNTYRESAIKIGTT